MTTRRGLFGWLAGALAAGAGMKAAAAPGLYGDEVMPFVNHFASGEHILPRTLYGQSPVGQIDDALKSMWESYSLKPTQIIITPDGWAMLRAHVEMEGKPDLFGIRRRLLRAKYLREYDLALADLEIC